MAKIDKLISKNAYDWKFSTVGGVTRVNIETGADVAHLNELDQKLWTVLSCPVSGLEFDEKTLEPHEYFCKMPADAAERDIFVVDPMLATGGSAIAAIDMLNKRGIKRIRFLCLIAAPEGLKALQEAHPEVDVYIGAMDDHLNENGYIVPGLGDAGDRIFGTK